VAEAGNNPASGESPTDSSAEAEPLSNIARTRRQKEAKDLAWSYNMEQALRQFLATHKASASFDVVLVDCRTTFCEIEAVGIDEDLWPTWGQISHDATRQPWSDFGVSGSSHEPRNGQSVFVLTLFRRDTPPPAPDKSSH
jgi:hypothetical protein